MNLLGLIPGLKSPTSNLSITLAMALIVFVMYQYYGIRTVGAKAYFRHLVGEPLWLAPLMLPIHITGELARPVSLAIRLFGNMFGEETIIAILAAMSFVIFRYHGVPIVAIPFQFPMMVFAVFTSFVQALVFSMLSCIYIAIATTSEHAEH
jgi:F-type H+-transporting ATPase subunit a